MEVEVLSIINSAAEARTEQVNVWAGCSIRMFATTVTSKQKNGNTQFANREISRTTLTSRHQKKKLRHSIVRRTDWLYSLLEPKLALYSTSTITRKCNLRSIFTYKYYQPVRMSHSTSGTGVLLEALPERIPHATTVRGPCSRLNSGERLRNCPSFCDTTVLMRKPLSNAPPEV